MASSPKRALVKSITYRILAVLANFIVTILITKSLVISLQLLIAGTVVSSVLYFFHERVWSKWIKYGKL